MDYEENPGFERLANWANPVTISGGGEGGLKHMRIDWVTWQLGLRRKAIRSQEEASTHPSFPPKHPDGGSQWEKGVLSASAGGESTAGPEGELEG